MRHRADRRATASLALLLAGSTLAQVGGQIGGLVAAVLLAERAVAHGGVAPPPPPPGPVGGTYRGPGDTGPSGPAGPSGPGASGGATSGPSKPSAPSTPSSAGSSPGGSGPSTGAASPRGPGVATGAADPSAHDSWESWWHFNKDGFLELKRAIAERVSTAGDDGFLSTARPSAVPSRELVRQKIVPALAHLLESERANDIASGALMALARIGVEDDIPAQESSIPRIVRALADPNQEVSETAALALGILRAEAALPHLVDLVSGGTRGGRLVGDREVPARTRAFAAYGLGLTAERAGQNRTRQMIARALVEALDDSRAGPDVQVAAAIGLSLDLLEVEARESTSAPWISRQTLLRHLMRVHADPKRHRFVRAHAATAIARLADGVGAPLRAEAIETLLGSVRDESKVESEVVQSSIQALGRIADPGSGSLERKVRSALARVQADYDSGSRAFALIALAEIGARAPAGTAVASLRTGARSAGTSAEPADAEAGEEECRSALLRALQRGRFTGKPWAAIALGLHERRRADRGAPRNERVRAALQEWLAAARGRSEVGSAAIALGLCRESRVASALRARLADTNEETGQGYVALALGMVGAVDAVPSLREVVRKARHRPILLQQAAEGLALLGDRGAAPEIAALLAEAKGLSAQASLAGALGFIGDTRSVDPLLVLIARKDLSASARGLAAAALGRVADESRLPWSASISCGLNYRAATATLYAGNGTGLLEIL